MADSVVHDLRFCRRFQEKTCEACIKFDALDRRIQELKALLPVLVDQQRAMLPELNRYHDPMDRIFPPELATRIMAFCMPPQDELEYAETPLRTPLTLSSVCKRWRTLAFDTPELWTFLSLRITNSNVNLHNMQTTEEWLSRSRHLPLHISISSPLEAVEPELYSSERSYTSRLWGVINSTSSRWRVFDVTLQRHQLHDLPNDSSQHSYAALEELRVRVTSFSNDPWAKRQGQFGHQGPQASPTRVLFDRLYLRNITIDWNNVTHVDFNVVYHNECLEILHRAPRLTSLVIRGLIPGSDTAFNPPSHITHEALQSLSFVLSSAFLVKALLDCLTLPSISYLNCQSTTLQHLISLVTRSAPPLVTLILKQAAHIAYLPRLLWMTPGLEHLELIDTELPASFFDAFSPKSTSPVPEGRRGIFLPHLRSCVFEGTRRDLTSSALLQLFEPLTEDEDSLRRPLKSLRIIAHTGEFRDRGLDYPIKPETFSRLLDIYNTGVEISIVNQRGADLVSFVSSISAMEED